MSFFGRQSIKTVTFWTGKDVSIEPEGCKEANFARSHQTKREIHAS